MLKIVHLLTGALALLLSFAPSFGNTPDSFLEQPSALCLALFGLLNLLLAPQLPIWHAGLRHQAQNLVSALLVLGTLLQALILLAWDDFASYPFQSHDLWFLTENQRWGY